MLVRNKALLSLKDYNLLHRLEDLADAGVDSFKIEGRLKNISYVKNTVRAYSQALDEIIGKHPDKYCRASFGKVSGGFTPDLNKTFNRAALAVSGLVSSDKKYFLQCSQVQYSLLPSSVQVAAFASVFFNVCDV